MDAQDDSQVTAGAVGGCMERVKSVTANLQALTTHTLAVMEETCQVPASGPSI